MLQFAEFCQTTFKEVADTKDGYLSICLLADNGNYYTVELEKLDAETGNKATITLYYSIQEQYWMLEPPFTRPQRRYMLFGWMYSDFLVGRFDYLLALENKQAETMFLQ